MIDVVRLTIENSTLLSTVSSDVFDENIEPRYLEAFLNDARHAMYLAVDKDTVVGMASSVEYFHPDKAPQLWINEVGVATTHRRRGIGRRLVEALIFEAERRGCTYAWLGTDADNISGKACFGSVRNGEEP